MNSGKHALQWFSTAFTPYYELRFRRDDHLPSSVFMPSIKRSNENSKLSSAEG